MPTPPPRDARSPFRCRAAWKLRGRPLTGAQQGHPEGLKAPFWAGISPSPGSDGSATLTEKGLMLKRDPQSQKERFEGVNCSIVCDRATLETAQVAVSKRVK